MHRSVIAVLTGVLLVSFAPGTARSQVASILLTKTVGIGPACATGDMLTVVQGTPVTYCYTAGNTGNATFMTHTIDDSVLGNIQTDFVFTLNPRGEGFFTRTFTPCSTMTNVATWTAQISGSLSTRSSTDTATVTVEEPVPSLLLTKTVSTDGTCPGVKQDVVLAGAKVTYCYEVGNNGNIELTVHSLVDSELGLIMFSPVMLDPGQESLAASAMAVINQDTVNDATATAVLTISCEDQTTVTRVQASDSAEVLVADPTPALENAALIVAALMLLGIGGLSLSRRRRLE